MLKLLFKRLLMTILGLTVVPAVFIILIWSGHYDKPSLTSVIKL